MAQGFKRLTEKNCFTCQSRERTEWCVLEDEELQQVTEGKTCREYLPGEVAFHEGDSCRGVHCIESGLIGIRKTDANGNEILL